MADYLFPEAISKPCSNALYHRDALLLLLVISGCTSRAKTHTGYSYTTVYINSIICLNRFPLYWKGTVSNIAVYLQVKRS